MNDIRAKYALKQIASRNDLIKGTLAQEPAQGLFPAYSASGQDVWTEQAEHFDSGIVLSAVGARCGKAFKADGEWTAIANAHALLPRNGFDRDFLWYIVNNESFWIKGGSAQPFVLLKESLEQRIPNIALDKQKAVVTFLDRETAKADALVAKYERLIELLEEKRTAVITQAVTKGLDPTVPMKDSGIEWIGHIPAGWRCIPLRHIVSKPLRNGIFVKSDRFSESGVPLVNVFDTYQNRAVIDEGTLARVLASGNEQSTYSAQQGDLFLVRSSLKQEGIGNTGLLVQISSPTVFECHLIRISPNRSLIRPKFLHYFMHSSVVRQRLVSISQTTTMTTISQPTLSALQICLPDLNMQDSIIGRIEHDVGEVDEISGRARAAIALTKEHRSALITAAVTGQIDVRTYRSQQSRELEGAIV